nr:IS1634 family transposase [Methanoculleus sp.]
LIAIVAASFLDRIEFVETIDAALDRDPDRWRVSPGNLAKGIVLLPFIHSGPRLPILNVSECYQGMDMELLFTSEVRPEWLTRDALACMLDGLSAAGCEHLFTSLALRVYTAFNIPLYPVLHGEATPISLYGVYEEVEGSPLSAPAASREERRRDPVTVTLGQACDPRGIPLITTVHGGDEADSAWSADVIRTLAELNPFPRTDVTAIADPKLATAQNIRTLQKKGFRFVTRCPASFGKKVAARVTRAAYEADAWIPVGSCRDTGEDTLEACDVQEFAKATDDGVSCRFLVFRDNCQRHKFEADLAKKREEFVAVLKEVAGREFAREPDARQALEEARKRLRRYSPWEADLAIETAVTGKDSRAAGWAIRAGDPQLQQEVYLAELHGAESFVLMTNVPGEDLPAREVLCLYTGQKVVRDNFSVIRRPAMVDTLYLEKPGRIAALGTLLSATLLIQMVIRVLVRRNLDALPEPPGLDHGCKPLIRPGLKKILRFIGYYSIITTGGERRFWCISSSHEKNLEIWLRLLELDKDR